VEPIAGGGWRNFGSSSQIDRLVDALADGEPAQRLTEKLRELERRRLDLESELTTSGAPAPRLHPNIAEAYRRKVAELHAALEADDAGPAREPIRGLVESIVLMPEAGSSALRLGVSWRRSCGFPGTQTKKLRV
jgi:site-specific DNA recombinase